jgi:hypothetical protein
VNQVGAVAAILGPALLFAFLWSEATFGPSQPNGGALRMAMGFQLILGAMICMVIALLCLRAQAASPGGRLERVGALLGYGAVALLSVGSVLWWPILLVWPDLGPVAGAPVGLGALGFFGAWSLLGLSALRQQARPGWARSLPILLFAVFLLLLYVMGTASPWALVVAVFAPFALGWALLAHVIWSAPSEMRLGT